MPLKVSDGIASWIKDFKKSDAPQFKGKNEKERRDMAIAAYLSAKRGDKNEDSYDPQKHEWGTGKGAAWARKQTPGQMNEETTFKVDVEGLPMMYITADSPGEVKAKLRGIVKQPSMIKDVTRVTDAEVKRAFRLKAQGRDDEVNEGSETWAAGYKRRVVKTTKPEHKQKGYKWRIKGKDRPEISIKLYKEKPGQAEFNKQMKRVAGHEFGG